MNWSTRPTRNDIDDTSLVLVYIRRKYIVVNRQSLYYYSKACSLFKGQPFCHWRQWHFLFQCCFMFMSDSHEFEEAFCDVIRILFFSRDLRGKHNIKESAKENKNSLKVCTLWAEKCGFLPVFCWFSKYGPFEVPKYFKLLSML